MNGWVRQFGEQTRWDGERPNRGGQWMEYLHGRQKTQFGWVCDIRDTERGWGTGVVVW